MKYIDEMNRILMEQAKRLNDINIKDDNFDNEIERAKAIALTACQYVNSESLVLKQQMMLSNRKSLTYDGDN